MFDVKPFEERMKKSISVMEEDFGTIRVGRANAKLLDKITVPYYGVPTGLDGVATIKTPDARTLLITPWETSVLKEIEKAILASDLGINPQNDGKAIRLSFPALTEERRKELTKKTAKMGEEETSAATLTTPPKRCKNLPRSPRTILNRRKNRSRTSPTNILKRSTLSSLKKTKILWRYDRAGFRRESLFVLCLIYQFPATSQ